MKRVQYQISVNGITLCTKYAWNTARRATPQVIKDFLSPHGAAVQTFHKYFKDDISFSHGIEQWQTDQGRVLNVLIQRV